MRGKYKKDYTFEVHLCIKSVTLSVRHMSNVYVDVVVGK